MGEALCSNLQSGSYVLEQDGDKSEPLAHTFPA